MPLPPHGGLPAIAPPQPATGLVRPIVFLKKNVGSTSLKNMNSTFSI
jgi:hypothetical protein